MQTKQYKKIISDTGIFALIIVGYYFLNRYFHIGIPCIFFKLTGFYCPGCGITRMFFSILHLQFYQAFRYNPLVFILLISYLFIKLYNFIAKKNIKLSSRQTYGLFLLIIIYGIFRNLDIFYFLRPTILNWACNKVFYQNNFAN